MNERELLRGIDCVWFLKKVRRENKVNYSIVINIEKREYWYKKCYI